MRFALTRRTLLAVASAFVGTNAISGPKAFAYSAEEAELPAGQNLLALLRHHHSAGEVGRAYLAIAPDEADPAILLRLLGADDPNLSVLDTEALRRIIRDRQRNDFAEGRTIMVRGWILSRTEVRLCALSALIGPGAFLA
jgi:hypothetical protein